MVTEVVHAERPMWRRQVVVLLSAIACFAAFGLYQVFLSMEAGLSNVCYLTPPGYYSQALIKKERHLLWYDCVLDPGNGEPRYTIHRPWQSVRNAAGDDPAFQT